MESTTQQKAYMSGNSVNAAQSQMYLVKQLQYVHTHKHTHTQSSRKQNIRTLLSIFLLNSNNNSSQIPILTVDCIIWAILLQKMLPNHH